MNKSLLISSVFFALLLASCESQSNEINTGKNEHERPVVSQVLEVDTQGISPVTKAQIVDRLLERDPSDNVGMLADARKLYDNYGDADSRNISNNLWAGSNGFSRNRRASGAIAVTAFWTSPSDWSTLRAGIAYVNGMGVDVNATEAIDILSDSSLKESSAAQFFLAKAYEIDGQKNKAKAQYQQAARMGHKLAIQKLNKL